MLQMQVVEIGLRGPSELGAGLGAEVLNDDLLNMPETAVQIADGEERLQALGLRLADADQNASRERHAQLARQPAASEDAPRAAYRASRNELRPVRTAAR